MSVAGRIGFHNAARTWEETYDTIALAFSVLEKGGHSVEPRESWLVHPASGYTLIPQLVMCQPQEDGGVRTTTTVQINHPDLCPAGMFEYQHSFGESTQESIRKGFEQWAETDLVALLDALEASPRTCTSLRMAFPGEEGRPALRRRAVLGPITHCVAAAPEKTVFQQSEDGASHNDHHPFCACCLVTNSFDAFRDLFESDRCYGLRLFAARNKNGVAEADCRVNGDDCEQGKQALLRYIETWPQSGIEFRKQYVVIHSLPNE